MNTLGRLRSLALVSLTALLAPLARAADTHTVNLTTPWIVGQAFSVSASSNDNATMTMSVGGQTAKEKSQNNTVRLEADGEALKIHANGGLRQVRYTVRSLRLAINAAPEADYLPKGSVIVVEQTNPSDKSVTIDGKAATPEQLATLESVLNADGAQHNDQLIFGPTKPVVVGETWAVNTTNLTSGLGEKVGQIGAAKGTMKLDGYSGEGAKGVAKVSGQTTIILKGAALPSGFSLKSGRMTINLDGSIPASRTGTERRENMTGALELIGEATTPDGRTAQIKVVSNMRTETTYRFR